MEVIDLTDEPQELRAAPVVVRVKPIGIEYSIDVVDLLDEEENPGRTVPALPATGASRPSCGREIIGGDDERLRMGSKTEGRRRHDDTTKNTKGASRPSCGREIIGGDDERLRVGSKTEGRHDSFTSESKSGAVQSYGNVVDPHPIPNCKDAIVSEPVHRGPANPLIKELSPADETGKFERNDIGLENAVRSRRKSATRTDKRSVTKRQKTIDLDSADDIPQCKIAGVCVNEPPLSAMPSRGSVPAKNAALLQNDRESASKHVGRNGGIHVEEKPAARTRPAPPSRVPNFILIDDSSDEESGSVRRHRRNQIRSTERAHVFNDAFQRGPLPPHNEQTVDKRFRPGADFNFDKSMKEALDEQEGLFRQAAASLHLHEEFLRNMRQPRHQRDCPIFTRAVDPSRLHQDHWKWQCVYARLGLPMHASDSIVKKQYRKHALRYHPDKCRLDDASTRFQAVTEAFNKIRQRS
ncbi:hypothetical protein MHU86_4277 [Fragilaria crotonensis]|nr:hypothetical protein MHU86_4277 [Fragilaria crotonensis]